MIVCINTVHSNLSGFDELASLAAKSKDISDARLDLDFSTCSFFEANMAAPLYAILSQNFDRLHAIEVQSLRQGAVDILRKNHFLAKFGYSEKIDIYQTTLPFREFDLHAGQEFAGYLEQYMRGKGIPEMSLRLKKKFFQSLFEIFQNASIHSQSERGIFTCGQFFPTKKKVDFTIADAGIGFRQNVRKYLRDSKISSCKAIEWALQEGHTTKTGKYPGGLGLKLIKDFISLNQGKIQIVSRYGFYEFTHAGESLKKMGQDFPGTCVNIEINTNDPYMYFLKSESRIEDIF